MTLMTHKRVRHLPVVEDTKVIGIVSIGDLLKYVISKKEFAIDQSAGTDEVAPLGFSWFNHRLTQDLRDSGNVGAAEGAVTVDGMRPSCRWHLLCRDQPATISEETNHAEQTPGFADTEAGRRGGGGIRFLGHAVGSDRTTTGELAARHLERVLLHGSNARLRAAMADLARELTPTQNTPDRPRLIYPRTGAAVAACWVRTAMYMNPSPQSENARTEIAEALSARLADGIELHRQIKVALSNVKGPRVAALHPLFEAFAVSLAGFNDTIAERAVTLGAKADGTVRHAAKTSQLADDPQETRRDVEHVKMLAERIDVYLAGLRVSGAVAAEHGDRDTASMLTLVVADFEKNASFLRASLEG